ncbi:MAG: 23S rRNA (guanosine(2251)-2'-O)-methyltransferase RlmB [Xanthomonadales bacterium]|nr:23S rRNA (guanosine(2251)-2'-O)-methyltransferase RlmB [Xanthomonadales bacterium]
MSRARHKPGKSGRTESWLVGINPVEGALSNDPANVRELLVAAGRQDARVRGLLGAAESADVQVTRADSAEFDRRFPGTRHQGVAALYRSAGYRPEADLAELVETSGNPLILVLDHIEDPRNFGACLRSAEAAGVTAVVFPRDRSVDLTPAARKAAAGAAERLPLVQVTNLARCLRSLKKMGLWVVGAAGDTGQSLYQLDLTGPTVVVLGSEGQGMHRLIRETCDFLAAIPMQGQAESLNVSVAAGVFLFEVQRQRLSHG